MQSHNDSDGNDTLNALRKEAERLTACGENLITAGAPNERVLAETDERTVLIDHQLSHCLGLDDEGRWAFRADHDVEEFTPIVKRYGERVASLKDKLTVFKQMSLVEA